MSESPTRPKSTRLTIRFTPAPQVAAEDDPLVAAANPCPSWLLHASDSAGGPWDIWHPLDLPSADTIRLMAIEGDLQGATGEQYMLRIREQVQLLVPELPDALFARLSGHQLFAIGVKAWQRPGETRQEGKERQADAANPLNGGGALVPSSPSPLVASDGATRP